MVYVEEEVQGDLDATLAKWLELIESIASDFEPLVFDGEARLRDARKIRHSIPSTMNERGADIVGRWEKSWNGLGCSVQKIECGNPDGAVPGEGAGTRSARDLRPRRQWASPPEFHCARCGRAYYHRRSGRTDPEACPVARRHSCRGTRDRKDQA